MALLHQQPNSPYWDENGNRTACYTACDGACDTCPRECFYGVDDEMRRVEGATRGDAA